MIRLLTLLNGIGATASLLTYLLTRDLPLALNSCAASFTACMVVYGIIELRCRRKAAQHRASMPVIGRAPLMTVGLLKRLSESQPADWRNPSVMRSKILAWSRKGGAQ